MSEIGRQVTKLPPGQEAIRAKCFLPNGFFTEFKNEEIEQSIPERFEKVVRTYPDRVAVNTESHTLTYDALNRVANRIARAILAQLGDGEEPVALLFDHGAFVIAAILAVLKAGKTYMSLDPADPDARTAYMLEDSRAKLLLTNTKHLSKARQLAQGGQAILNCDDLDAGIATGNLDRRIAPETCALVLYTSGSTGRPKGVLHNHRNILVETRTYTNDVRISPDDRLALWHSCSYANSIRNMYGALLNGATLFPYDLATGGIAPLAGWMRTQRITIVHTVATTFRRFCDTIPVDAEFPALRILRLGGEPINREDVKCFQCHFSPQCILVHAIGPTETFTIRRHFITRDRRSSESKVPLGYAVPDKEVLLLDETGREVGVDQIGEIVVRSKYLALGYWRRPDLTQTAFIPDPRGGDERLYFTGDLGMMRPDGCLIHMGRKDFQVKIRGYRVEVGEIEAALLGLESVKAAVVHAQARDPGEQRLVAYVVPTTGSNPTVSELRRVLVQALPDYMIPSAFVFLDTLPLLPNGKIDRKALPAPDQSRPLLENPVVAPRTAVEDTLTGFWAEVLGLDQVGIHDNFFELGGNSLLATQVIFRINDAFNVDLSLQSLYETQTVAELAATVMQSQAG
jgi:amino acid adenylation domain-containing protein